MYNTLQKFEDSRKTTLICTLNQSKVTVKLFKMFKMIYFSNKCCSFELSIHQRILKKIKLSVR